ncbi:MAG: hypothetical protein LBL76_06825 [Treponema sp.]|jgi:hypothetical protein|nr:hypothetical protein [Treponema sp.]
MKKIIMLLVMVLGLSVNIFSNDINYEILSIIIKNINLDFSFFPTKNNWNRNVCIPILDTRYKKKYQTIITNASKQEPNFDGKYRIIEFGYGSGAQMFFIIDLNNGNVYEGISSTHGIKYRVNSSLIIINDPDTVLENWQYWDEDMPNWVFIAYVLWENNNYKKIVTINPFNE